MSIETDIFAQIDRLPTTSESEALIAKDAPRAIANARWLGASDLLACLGLRPGGVV